MVQLWIKHKSTRGRLGVGLKFVTLNPSVARRKEKQEGKGILTRI